MQKLIISTVLIVCLLTLFTACEKDPTTNNNTNTSVLNKILFQAVHAGGNLSQLHTINSDGSNNVQLTSFTNAYAAYPAWSPDGTKIVFLSDKDDSNGELYSMNADGSGITRLTNNSRIDAFPIWR